MQKDYKSKLNELVEIGINKGSCVLFIGPEFIKYNGKDCHLAFYDTLPENDGANLADKEKARYDADEKIWHFDSKKIKANFCIKYEKFLSENRDINNPLFHKLASIPFPLIVSLIPDDTLKAAFLQYENFNFSFRSFMSDSQVEEPSLDHLLIYNIYGCISGGYYVASHCDYLTFIRDYVTTGFPKEFRSAIIKARYLVFIGFEFDKWYNILLLYILNDINKNVEQNCAVEEQSAEELYKKLSDSDLNLFFIEKNGEQYIDDLYNNEKIVLRKIILQEEYLMNMIQLKQEAIEKIKDRIPFSDPMEEHRLKLDLEILEKENIEFINRLNKKRK